MSDNGFYLGAFGYLTNRGCQHRKRSFYVSFLFPHLYLYMDELILKPPLPIKLESVGLLLDTTFDNGGISMFTDNKGRNWYLTLVTDEIIEKLKKENEEKVVSDLSFSNGGSGVAK